MLAQDFNPYSAPVHDISPLPPLSSYGGLTAHCVQRGWLTRTIILSGRINAEIKYLGWTAGESVLVDGVLVGKCYSLYFSAVSPRIDFALDFNGVRHSGTVLARAPFIHLCKLKSFSLIVDGELLYCE